MPLPIGRRARSRLQRWAAPPAEPLAESPGIFETRQIRRRLGLGGEFALAALPTLVILVVLAMSEALTRQRLLFASLASSAFLIYLEPEHPTNRVRTIMLAQGAAALLGWLAYTIFGPGYAAVGVGTVAVIVAMILLDAVHPPAVATGLSFALRAGGASNLSIFALALGVMAVLVLLQQSAVHVLARLTRHHDSSQPPPP